METFNVYLLWLIAGTIGALIAGTLTRVVALRNSTVEIVQKRMQSLKVWWVLVILWSTAATLGQLGMAALLATASLLAMREYLNLMSKRDSIEMSAKGCLVIVGVTHYLLIILGHSDAAKWFLPTAGIVLLGAAQAMTGQPDNFVRRTAGMYWGAMLMIYALSHALLLLEIQSEVQPIVGVAGWFLFLVLLTEMNDIMQAIVGRKFGKTKIAPIVSPNKSLEGLAGGVVTTIGLSIILAPLLTSLTTGRGRTEGILLSSMAGVAISLSGYLGDINMSCIKRDAGVKDGSTMLPGMGGIIDRIDSLTFTAPVFYYFVQFTSNLHVNA